MLVDVVHVWLEGAMVGNHSLCLPILVMRFMKQPIEFEQFLNRID